MAQAHQYKAVVKRVVDGDTFIAVIELGFGLFLEKEVRLYPIDTPETNRKETREAGLKSKKRLKELIENKEVLLVAVKAKEKFGRFIARCFLVDDGFSTDVGQILLDENLGEEYYGGKKKS